MNKVTISRKSWSKCYAHVLNQPNCYTGTGIKEFLSHQYGIDGWYADTENDLVMISINDDCKVFYFILRWA